MIHWLPAVVVLFIFVTLLAANFRYVQGATPPFIKRQYLGFDDAVASMDDCTSGPWIAALSAHGPLCRDLQRAGVLESDAAREGRLFDETRQIIKGVR